MLLSIVPLNYRHLACAAAICGLLLTATTGPAIADGCSLEPQGEGRVTGVIDARTLRLDDGRDVILARIEPVASDDANTREARANRIAALSAIVAGHDVTLHGEDD